MTPRLSLYLNGLRFAAALIVFLSHFAYPRFSDGHYVFIRELNLGSDAVIIFFVLSGLVISHTARTKDKTISEFLWSRATRLYSVAIPALLLTLIFDHFGAQINAENYAAPWYDPAPVWQQLFRGLTFSNEWFLSGLRLGSNGPYWSLSYEAAYYLIFASAFYMTGWRRALLLTLLVLISGPSILILLPVWLMGVALYKFINTPLNLPTILLWLMALAPPAIYVICLNVGLPPLLLQLTEQALSQGFVRGILRFSNEFIWNGFLGLLVTTHIAGLAFLFRSAPAVKKSLLSRFIRHGAGASFSIYLVHYPALQFFDAALPQIITARNGILFTVTIIFCFLFAACTERQLPRLRYLLKNFKLSGL